MWSVRSYFQHWHGSKLMSTALMTGRAQKSFQWSPPCSIGRLNGARCNCLISWCQRIQALLPNDHNPELAIVYLAQIPFAMFIAKSIQSHARRLFLHGSLLHCWVRLLFGLSQAKGGRYDIEILLCPLADLNIFLTTTTTITVAQYLHNFVLIHLGSRHVQ